MVFEKVCGFNWSIDVVVYGLWCKRCWSCGGFGSICLHSYVSFTLEREIEWAWKVEAWSTINIGCELSLLYVLHVVLH